LLECPDGLQFGIDNQFWETGPQFKGLKAIPPGAHYVYFALKDENYENRMGFFIHVREASQPDTQDVVVKKWSPENQLFESLGEQETLAFSESVRNMDFDRNLGAYPMDNLSQWQGLSGFISREVVDRLDSLNHYTLSEGKERELRDKEDVPAEEEGDIEKTMEAIEKQVREEEAKQEKAAKRLYKYREAFTGGSYYTDIPAKKVLHGLTGSALTEANFDKTSILRDVLSKVGSPAALLAELQYAFVSFVVGENLESFEHWKRLVHLLCTCSAGLHASDPLSAELFMKFVPVMYEQLRQLPKDFFSDDLSKVSFLKDSLNAFSSNVEDERVSPALKARAGKLRKMLQEEYGFYPAESID